MLDHVSSSAASSEASESDIEIEDIRGSDVIVIQPGSSYLRIGFSKDVFPTTIPHCIARRVRGNQSSNDVTKIEDDKEMGNINQDTLKDSDWEEIMEGALNSLDQSVGNRRVGGSRKREKAANSTASVMEYNEGVQGEKIPVHLDHTEVDWITMDDREFVVGDEVARLKSSDDVQIFYPIRKGMLNVQSARGIEAVKADLCHIWTTAIKNYLNISRHRIPEFRAVVLVPDQYRRSHVRAIVEMLLEDMGFAACLVHQESVCATFGAGMTSCCLVDVGAQKISVCCVEEGLSLPASRVTMNYGGDDITRLLYWLAKRIHYPYKECESGDYLDWQLLDEMKIQLCHLYEDEGHNKPYEFVVRRPDQLAFKYSMRFADECFKASVGLFVPNLLGKRPYSDDIINRTSLDNDPDPTDILDDVMLLDVQRDTMVYQYGFKAMTGRPITAPSPCPVGEEGNVLTMSHVNDDWLSCKWIGCTLRFDDLVHLMEHVHEDHVGRKQSSYVCSWESCSRAGRPFPHKPAITAHLRTHIPVMLDKVTGAQSTAPTPTSGRETPQPPIPVFEEEILEGSLSIDEAINLSIGRSGNEDCQKKFYDAIMLCGGGYQVHGFSAYLENQLRTTMPIGLRESKIQILENPRDMDPRILSWKGASILARLDYADDYWITTEEWRDQGVNILRDCLPFVF